MGDLTLQDAYEFAIESNPQIQFINVQTKHDGVQVLFANVLSITFSLSLAIFPSSAPSFSQESFYKETNNMLKRFFAHANFNAYLIASARHTILRTNSVFTATPAGREDACKTTDSGQLLIDFLTGTPAGTQSQCWDLTAENTTEFALD